MSNNENQQRKFSSGAVRESSADKGRFDLLPPRALFLLAKHFQIGAERYGERNWEKGMPVSVFIDSGFRHLIQFMSCKENEDHLVAAAWNLLAAIETRERIKEGILPNELNWKPEPEK
jgi:hypothetical protein